MNTEEKPINNEYDVAKWKRIMDVTQNNYANMIKRLERRYKVSNYALIYYSIFLIIMTLTAHYFPRYFHAKLGEYFGVILSIVVLAYSLINNSANYSVRIADVERALNKIKTIKRELNEESIETCKKNYNAVTDATERRDDMDFFITVENLCKAYDISIFAKPKKNRDDNSEIEDRSGEKWCMTILVRSMFLRRKQKYCWNMLPIYSCLRCQLEYLSFACLRNYARYKDRLSKSHPVWLFSYT